MKQDNQLSPGSDGQDRIIVIGLDSADPDLVQMWAKAGRLPFMSSLIESGVWTRLASTSDVLYDSAWPSFNTGVSPAKHGWYDYLQLKRGTTDMIRGNAHDCRYPPFWTLLRNTGKKVAIFDVPKVYPLEDLEGIQVAGWGESYPLVKVTSLPLVLAEELSARVGKYRHPKEIINPRRTSQEMGIYNTLITNIERKANATQFLLGQQDWDLFITVFAEAHYAAHQFYHHYDERHWAYDPKRAARWREALPNTYIALDAALGRLLKGILREATIFIVSVHGIEPNYSGNHLLATVLERLGFQVSAAQQNGTPGLSRITNVFRRLREGIPGRVREFVNDQIVPQSFHDQIHARRFRNSIDWKRTKAFLLPSEHFQACISINLKGREPWGVIQPGPEYEDVCSRLGYELKRLVNPETGKPAVRDVVQIAKVYKGENVYLLPDVVIQWAKDGPINQLYHPTFGLITKPHDAPRQTQHTAEGFLIAAGKGIKKAARITQASTMDLAPTILYLMGQSVPKDMDGTILWDLLDEDVKSLAAPERDCAKQKTK